MAEAYIALKYIKIKKNFDHLLTIAVNIPRKIIKILFRYCLICMPQQIN